MTTCTAAPGAGQALCLPAGTPRKLLKLAAACLDADPARRPSAAEALKALTLMIRQHAASLEALGGSSSLEAA